MTSAAISRPRALLQTLFGLTLAFFALAASNPAWADPPGRVGRIADTDGNVWVFEDEQGEWVQARRNRPVTEGDRLSAERGARAEVQIGSGTLRLDGGTDVEFPRLDDSRVEVRLLGGSVALRVRGSLSVREFAITTAEGRFEPLRPGHYRVDVEERSSLGETFAGAMRFEARDSVLQINDGQRAEFWQEGGVTHYAWSGPSNDRFGDWVARQDREETRERNRYVSEEMTGAGDLDRHGHWDRHPEYGAVWYPSVVAPGWAPYRYGHWAYVRPWGWTWVDDAPWGFAPFHYGRWVHWGGRWAWAPGQYVARPVYAPALVAWFGGPNVSVGINIGGGPAVGWVPLAPREIYYPGYHHSPTYVRIVNRTHERWYGPRPNYERPVRTGPIMYTNQGVAGGVTVVPQSVVQSRQPIGSRVVMPVDARTVASWQAASPRGVQAVPPPAARVVAAPGGAVPAPPNATRTAPWGRAAQRVTGGQDDGVRGPSRSVVAPPPNVGRVITPVPQGQVATPQRPVQEGREREERSRDERVLRPDAGRVIAPVPQGQVPTPAQRPPRDLREREERGRPDNGREERGDRRIAPPAAHPQLQRIEPPQVQRTERPQVQRIEPPQVQRIEPPQVRPVQPAVVVPPAPQLRNDGGGDAQRGRAGNEQRYGGPQRDDDRMQRGREPRNQQQLR
jgi:hypothetical protein